MNIIFGKTSTNYSSAEKLSNLKKIFYYSDNWKRTEKGLYFFLENNINEKSEHK